MNRRVNHLLLTGLLMLASSAALAANATKTNEWIGASGDWADSANWSRGHMPADDELAWFNPAKGIEVTVNADYTPGAFYVGPGSKTAPITFKGSGTITLGKYGPSPYIRSKHPVTLDGVTLDVGNSESLWYSSVTLKNGGTFKTTKQAYLWGGNATLTIDDGTFVGGNLLWDTAAAINLNSGSLTCANFHCREGSSVVLNLNVSGGTMTVNGTPTLLDSTVLNLTGGELVFGQKLTERRFLTETKGTTIRVKGMDSAGCSIDLLAEPNETVTFGASVFAEGSLYVTNAAYVTVAAPAGATLGFRTFRQERAGGRSTLDARTVVLGTAQAFDFSNAGVSGDNGRFFEIQGPVTFRPTADMATSGTKSVYPFVSGDAVIDTTDYADPTVGRAMAFRGLGARAHATLTIRGLGSAAIMQTYPATPFAKVEVEAGATLSLYALSGGSDYGPFNTDLFVLGPNATLKIPAGEDFVQAARWQIDPTAKIVIDIPEGVTVGAMRALSDLSGSLASAGQIELTGAGASGWTAGFASGALVLTKAVAGGVDGKYDWEWTGLGSDNAFATAANWVTNTVPLSDTGITAYFGAGCEQRSDVALKKAFTLPGLVFRDTASKPYVVSGATTFTVKLISCGSVSKSSVASQSALPVTLNTCFRSFGQISLTALDGALILGNQTSSAFQFDKAKTGILAPAGDVRLGGAVMRYPQLGIYKIENGGRDYRKIVGSHLTILSGASLTLTNQTVQLNPDNQSDASFRINANGRLTFNKGSSDARYYWRNKPAKIVVDGELAVDIPFVGQYDQTYGGAGTIKLSSVLPTTLGAAVTLSDSVALEPSGDWVTVAKADDLPLTLVAAATPTIRLADDWTYGAAADSGTATEASARALVVGRDAVLTVDANGHAATFADPVTGAGVLAVTNGAMRLSSGTDVAAVRLDPTGVLALADDLTLPNLVSKGGALQIESGAVLTCTAADVTGLHLAFTEESPKSWTTVLVADEITGTPSDADHLRYRVVETAGVQNLQCRQNLGGLIIIVN